MEDANLRKVNVGFQELVQDLSYGGFKSSGVNYTCK